MDPISQQRPQRSGLKIILKHVLALVCYAVLPYLIALRVYGFEALFTLIYIGIPVHLLLLTTIASKEYKNGDFREACLHIYTIPILAIVCFVTLYLISFSYTFF
jgi:hypothetical protein